MKYMRWSYDQLVCMPAHYYDAIERYAEREAREAEEARREAERRT